MSRRRAAVKRTLLKDPKYNDTLVSKFVCSLMKHGKKSVAERILYGALDLISDREKETPSLDVFRTAVENVKPAMEVKSRRVGGSTYQVPMQVRSEAVLQQLRTVPSPLHPEREESVPLQR